MNASPLNYLVQTMPPFLQNLEWKRRQGMGGDEFLDASTPWVAGKTLALMWRKGPRLSPDFSMAVQESPTTIGLVDVFSGHAATYEDARKSLLQGIKTTEHLSAGERAMYLAAFDVVVTPS